MKPRALSTLIVPVRFCMPTTGVAAPSVTVSCPSWPWMLSVLVAGGEHVDRVVAGAGVEGRRVERRRVVHDERVAAAAAVDRERREVERLVGRGGDPGARATLPEGTCRRCRASRSGRSCRSRRGNSRSVRQGGLVTEIGPWMSAIVPGPPVEPMLTVSTPCPNDVQRTSGIGAPAR